MNQPTIVLHVVGRLDIGGAESRIMDLYRNIDREKVQFVFCQHTKDHCAFEEEVESLGGKVYHVPRFNVKNYFYYKKDDKLIPIDKLRYIYEGRDFNE